MYKRPAKKNESNILKKIKLIPILPVIMILILVFISFITLYSAAQGSLKPWAIKQAIYVLFTLPIMFFIIIMDIKILYRLSYLAYFAVLFLLIAMEVFGYRAMGAVRWINLGFIKIQPSELVKVTLILALSRYFHSIVYENIKKNKYLLIPIILVLIPFLLILKQPDLGTSIIVLVIAGTIFFSTGIQSWKFYVLIGTISLFLPILWNKLHEYQKNRILTFLNPEGDPLGAGYNIIQSKIAIGSGGIFGKGLMNGSQSQLDFLPEHQTDFIFTMIAEEMGFLVCSAIIFIYGLIILFGIYSAVNIKHHYGRLVSIGITSLFAFHVIINMGMVCGLLPVVGVPLPLLSYGGTITTTTLLALGLLLNCYINKNSYIGGKSTEIL